METYLRINGFTDVPLKIRIHNPLEARQEIGITNCKGNILRIDRIGILEVQYTEITTSSLIYNCKMKGIIGDDEGNDMVDMSDDENWYDETKHLIYD